MHWLRFRPTDMNGTADHAGTTATTLQRSCLQILTTENNMRTKPQTLMFLTEILGVVIRHDPITAARTTAVYDRRSKPRVSKVTT